MHDPAIDAPDISPQVDAAEVQALYTRLESLYPAEPVAIALVAWYLWPLAPQAWLLGWLAARLAILTLKMVMSGRFAAEPSAALRVQRWRPAMLWALGLDGLVWGLPGCALPLGPGPEAGPAMVALVLGVAALGHVMLAGIRRALPCFVLPLVLPTLACQAVQQGRLAVFLTVGLGLFVLLGMWESGRAARQFHGLLQTRFRAAGLALQRQQALQRARRSDNAKTRFLAVMGHEVRTPLHGVLGLARLLQVQNDTSTPQQRAAQLQALGRAGEHLLQIVDDLLDMSRIEAEHLVLHRTPGDLGALVASVAELFRPQAQAKGLQFQLEMDLPQPCRAEFDAARLRQVLLNLLSNALKFTRWGAITLRARRQGDAVIALEVQDTGPGVPEVDRERIFQAFEQADTGGALRPPGTGLGLTIARELARAMGGDLLCQAAPGGGALFRVLLPVAAGGPPAPEAPAEAAAPPPPPRPGHVLVVEDEPVSAMVIEAWLQQAGVTVLLAATAQQALALLEQQADIRLVLMDLQLPDMNGLAAAALLWQRQQALGRPRLPVVALTASASPTEREQALAAGLDGYLTKPFNDQALAALLARHLQGGAAAAGR